MPVDPLDDPQRAQRLRLGRGIPGGGRALPGLFGPSSSAQFLQNVRPRPIPQAQPPQQPQNVPQLVGPPPTQHIPLLPGGAGHAIDLTPQSRQLAPQYRGAALLRRFAGLPIGGGPQTAPPGKGVKDAVKLLRNPDKLFDPAKKKQLDLLTHPGPKVQALVANDPVLSRNYAGLQEHVATKGPVPLPAQDLVKKLQNTVGKGKMNPADFITKYGAQIQGLDDESKKRFSDALDVAQQTSRNVNVAAGKANVAGVAPPVQKVLDSGIWQNAINQMLETGTGMVPSMVAFAKDPVGTTKQMAAAEKQYYGPLFTGDIGQFKKNVTDRPLTLPMDVGAVFSAGLGTAGRFSALSKASEAFEAATAQEALPNGVVRVGGRYHVNPTTAGHDVIDTADNGRLVANMPDQASAIAHAESLGFSRAGKSAFMNALHAVTHPELYGGHRGSLIDLYTRHNKRAQAKIAKEDADLVEALKEVAADPNVRTKVFGKEARQSQIAGARADVKKTLAEYGAAINERDYGKLGAAGYKEIVSGIRHGAIYLRPAYLPNNWAGNAFMNLTHQGFLAPVNLAKSAVVFHKLQPEALAQLRRAGGLNPAEAISQGSARGVVTSALHPLVERAGHLADQPFRDAAVLHELRKAGVRKLKDVNDLLMKAHHGDEDALATVARAGNAGQEEVVKFKDLNPKERAVASNGLFVWNWVRGSTRYLARYPGQHPLQAAAMIHAAPIGNQQVQAQTGGMPWFMSGSIPVGRTKDGDPIMVNPFALNPLGSGIGFAQDIAGTVKALRHPEAFNKYSDPTILDLTNPLIQAVTKRVTGMTTRPFVPELAQQIAPLRLLEDLKHPGRGGIFPMSRQEALGHYIVGALWPRHASQEALTSALERENINNPQALLDTQVKDYEKATGIKVPENMIAGIKGDLDSMQHIKDYQRKYANSIGSSGFRHLPPINKVESAIKYLREHHTAGVDEQTLQQYEQAAQSPGMNDQALEQLSNALWGMTQTGEYKQAWDNMRAQEKSMKTTKRRG